MTPNCLRSPAPKLGSSCARFTARLRGVLIGLMLVTAASSAYTAELRAVRVSSSGEGYELRTEVMIAAPADAVRKALSQFERLPSLNPNIESVEILPSTPGGEPRLLLRTKACVLFFCKRYQWVQQVSNAANGDVIATVEPAHSDFRRGAFHYRFRPLGENSLLITEAQLEPKRALLGAWLQRGLMRNLLGYEAVTLSSRLERLLNAKAGSTSSDRA